MLFLGGNRGIISIIDENYDSGKTLPLDVFSIKKFLERLNSEIVEITLGK